MISHCISNGDILSVLSYLVHNIDVIRILIYNDDRLNYRWICAGTQVQQHPYIITNLQLSRCICQLFTGITFNRAIKSDMAKLSEIKIKPRIPSLILVRLPHHIEQSAITDIVFVTNGTTAYTVTGDYNFTIKELQVGHIFRLLQGIDNGNPVLYKRLTGFYPLYGAKVMKCNCIPITSQTNVELVIFMINMTISRMVVDLKESGSETTKQLNGHRARLQLSMESIVELIGMNIRRIEERLSSVPTMIGTVRLPVS